MKKWKPCHFNSQLSITQNLERDKAIIKMK